MLDIVIHSKHRIQYGDGAERLIRDIAAPMGSVGRLHRRLFKRPKKHIPVVDISNEVKKTEPVSAFMIDPKYLPKDVAVFQKMEPNAQRAPIVSKHLPRVIQYSKISRDLGEPVTLTALNYTGLITTVSHWSDRGNEYLSKLNASLSDTFAALSDTVASWYQKSFIAPSYVYYSVHNSAQSSWMSTVQDILYEVYDALLANISRSMHFAAAWYAARVTKYMPPGLRLKAERAWNFISGRAAPIMTVLLISVVALYGLFASYGYKPPESDTSAGGLTLPMPNGSGFTLGASDDSSSSEDSSSDDEDKDDDVDAKKVNNNISDNSVPKPYSDTSTQSSATPEAGRGGGDDIDWTEHYTPPEPNQTDSNGGETTAPEPTNTDVVPEDPIMEPGIEDPVLVPTNPDNGLIQDITIPGVTTELGDTKVLQVPEIEISL